MAYTRRNPISSTASIFAMTQTIFNYLTIGLAVQASFAFGVKREAEAVTIADFNQCPLLPPYNGLLFPQCEPLDELATKYDIALNVPTLSDVTRFLFPFDPQTREDRVLTNHFVNELGRPGDYVLFESISHDTRQDCSFFFYKAGKVQFLTKESILFMQNLQQEVGKVNATDIISKTHGLQPYGLKEGLICTGWEDKKQISGLLNSAKNADFLTLLGDFLDKDFTNQVNKLNELRKVYQKKSAKELRSIIIGRYEGLKKLTQSLIYLALPVDRTFVQEKIQFLNKLATLLKQNKKSSVDEIITAFGKMFTLIEQTLKEINTHINEAGKKIQQDSNKQFEVGGLQVPAELDSEEKAYIEISVDYLLTRAETAAKTFQSHKSFPNKIFSFFRPEFLTEPLIQLIKKSLQNTPTAILTPKRSNIM